MDRKIGLVSSNNYQPNADYDPHAHRQLPAPTNNLETLIHLVKCSLGTGILAMPQAYANAGLITGVVGTILGGILVTHCLHVIINSQYLACQRRRVALISYPETMSESLLAGPKCLHGAGPVAAITVDIFLVTYQLGICCVYIVFLAENAKKLMLPTEISVLTCMAILLPPLVAFNLIPSLKLLAPFSALANVLILMGLAIVVYYLVATTGPSKKPLVMLGTLTSFPLFFGTILFALTSVGVVVALENNMATPRAFVTPCGVLNTGMSLIVVLYVLLGALGYNYCRAECKDSISLNLPTGTLTSSILVMFMVAVFISYVLHCFVPIEVVWRYVEPRLDPATSHKYAKTALRIALCVFTFMLAAAVPRLGLFISLVGALCLSALGLCFPAIMESCLSYPHKERGTQMTLFKDVLLFIVGLLGLVVGTGSAVAAIIASF